MLAMLAMLHRGSQLRGLGREGLQNPILPFGRTYAPFIPLPPALSPPPPCRRQ